MASSVLQLPTIKFVSLRTLTSRASRRVRAWLPRRWVIPWEMSENGRYWDRAIYEAKARGEDRDEIMSMEANEAHDYWVLEEELEMLESSRLLSQARRYFLATPEFTGGDKNDDPNWRQGTSFKPTWFLRPHAMEALRSKVRAERKARLDPVGEWIKISGAAIAGLGGAWYLFKELRAFFSV